MAASSWVPPSLPESGAAASGLVLLDRWCYIADLPNDTSAKVLEFCSATGGATFANSQFSLPAVLELCEINTKQLILK
jgi:hypothetical protein